MISLDTETTGVDFRHGARPFFVTSCSPDGTLRYWEWDVDPLTRDVLVPEEDVAEIRALLKGEDLVVLQNPKFDVAALTAAGIFAEGEWDWSKTVDTLLAGHLLASNQPHDLTSMAVHYLGVDIEPLEKSLEGEVKAARSYCHSHLKDWAVAKEGRPDMPSAGEKTWKADYWLPRVVVKHLWGTSKAGTAWEAPWLLTNGEEAYRNKIRKMEGWQYRPPEVEGGDHPWWKVLRDYSNADSSITIALWSVMREELRRRNLYRIYESRLKLLPVIHGMESGGVTVSGSRMEELITKNEAEVDAAARLCVNIAASYGHDLVLPKGASPNQNLRTFMMDVLKVEPVYSKKSKTAAPTLDKNAMDHYLATLPPRSKELKFVETLLGKRKRDTSLAYLRSYQKFWRSLGGDTYVLHPNLNPTGTDTLRCSSNNPNGQNISKNEITCRRCHGEGCEPCRGTGKEFRSLRYCFGPAPGREWWSLDAKNIELRLPALLSGERELIDLFERPDDPPYYGSTHLLNFHTVYPDLWNAELRIVGEEKVGPFCKKKYAATWYQWCKNGGFAIQYGAQDRAGGGGTADRAFHRTGAHALLKKRFSRLERLNQETVRFAEKYGYVETIPDRTVDPERGYPLMCTRTEWGRIMPTVPLSYRIQGSAMWWTTKAMVKCQAQLDEWREDDGFDGRIALQVHDELVFDFPKGVCPVKEKKRSNLGRIRVIQGLMASCGQDFVPSIPTPVGVEYHADNWSEGVTLG